MKKMDAYTAACMQAIEGIKGEFNEEKPKTKFRVRFVELNDGWKLSFELDGWYNISVFAIKDKVPVEHVDIHFDEDPLEKITYMLGIARD